MLIDDTHEEETRVVVINGNKLEDVEFETSSRKQIKSNVYLAKVMRIEPSLQAAFVDYGGNRHGFLAFGEIHPDYYNISEKDLAEMEREIEASIELKKQQIRDRELERARIREEKAVKRAQQLEQEALEKEKTEAETKDSISETEKVENKSEEKTEQKKEKQPRRGRRKKPEDTGAKNKEAAETKNETVKIDEQGETAAESEAVVTEEKSEEVSEQKSNEERPSRQYRGRRPLSKGRKPKKEEAKTIAAKSDIKEDSISEEVSEETEEKIQEPEECGCSEINDTKDDNEIEVADDDDDEDDFEVQKRLMLMRKLYHQNKIQDVIKEGQILLVQIVKEERGNKGAALTTYLSLAGRYCVLMPNRIKSGGVSRKITNVQDRKRLKSVIKELPIPKDMSLIVRTAGEEKTKSDITRDYNYLIRTWNEIRTDALTSKAPTLIYEEGNLIKKALRDMFTKEISEIIIDGESAYKAARNFMKILSPHTMKKLKPCKPSEAPLFQRFQIESQLDKLHDTNVQLESGGYLVINPTEALVSIDVNSGRATKEKDLEETAIKTNLEAADEIAKQLRMRNLAGLVVIDFIDMEEPRNNIAVEKRMKEAMKKDRARVQIGKMSCFGLLEISRQRLHSSFLESNYQTCPYCHGRGIVRTIESGAIAILRAIEEEGTKNRSAKVNISVPADVAIYLLNQKRATITEIEEKYKMQVIISADNNIKNITDYRIERTKQSKIVEGQIIKEEVEEDDDHVEEISESTENHDTAEKAEGVSEENDNHHHRGRRDRRYRYDRRRNGNGNRNRNGSYEERGNLSKGLPNDKKDTKSESETNEKGKVSWWKKLIS